MIDTKVHTYNPPTIFNEEDIKALRSARDSVKRSSDEISRMFEEAEHSGDYSDADELAADHREQLHEEFTSLLNHFATKYPGLFEEV
ncbi:hypothetical protein CRB1_81 [Mycobacterium phage CRB1]|uniref:hypothetical protein n=1 Tax=Mycobacterium phage CRB1 TaxID=1458841 RepID=UPI0003F2033D|nr:hypothetical protein CRB1_81 [Mycobacterium phage CRB1]AHJ86692.1 hypothetical protein CRB1_81 [Mycobacterium phage CRB1]